MDAVPAATAPGRASARRQVMDVEVPIQTVLRSRGYWQYVLGLTLQQAGFSALVIFQIPALISFGLTDREAGLAVLIWTLGSIPGRIGSGYLADIVDKRWVLTGSVILQLIGGIILLNVSTFPQAVLYGLVHGAGWGALTPSRLALQGEYWGRSIFGRLMGIQAALSAFGGIASPLFVGFVFDRTQDYHTPLLIMFLPLLLCIALTLTITRPKQPEGQLAAQAA
jgi:MFS family permease